MVLRIWHSPWGNEKCPSFGFSTSSLIPRALLSALYLGLGPVLDNEVAILSKTQAQDLSVWESDRETDDDRAVSDR